MANNNRKKIPGNIIKWILAVFMFSGCLVYWFSFASIIFALLGVYFLPIAPIQNFFNKVMPKKKVLRGIIAFVIFVVGCCVAPQVETTAPEATNPTDITISSEATSEPTVDRVCSTFAEQRNLLSNGCILLTVPLSCPIKIPVSYTHLTLPTIA